VGTCKRPAKIACPFKCVVTDADILALTGVAADVTEMPDTPRAGEADEESSDLERAAEEVAREAASRVRGEMSSEH
jgi:hypothetical protein